MVGVVHLHDKVGHRQLKLMQPKPAGLRLWRQTVPRAEIEQDVRGLPDHEFAGLEERRRKRRCRALLHQPHHRSRAAFARHIDIRAACFLEREADIFAAALDRRPIVELVPHQPVFLA